MIDEPRFTLLSIETDVARPRVLTAGSLGACLDALKETVLHDTVACNRARLEIISTDPAGGRGGVVTIFQGLTLGQGI